MHVFHEYVIRSVNVSFAFDIKRIFFYVDNI
jgi:hypothetical protein